MRQKVTVDKAINRGQIMVNVSALLALIGIPALGFYLYYSNMVPLWVVPVSLVMGFVCAWLVWSVMVTKWKIWAYENVEHLHELKKRAVEARLIWPDGSIFNKTEIKSASDKQRLEKLEKKFENEDVYKEDFSLPKTTNILISKSKSQQEIGIGLFVIAVGIYLCISDSTKNQLVGALLIVITAFSIFKALRKLINRKPQITLSDEGLTTHKSPFKKWSSIYSEEVKSIGHGKNSKIIFEFYYDQDGYEKIDLAPLAIKRSALENMLRTYRMRFEKMQ